jgi:hypothetical protein
MCLLMVALTVAFLHQRRHRYVGPVQTAKVQKDQLRVLELQSPTFIVALPSPAIQNVASICAAEAFGPPALNPY